MCKCVVMNVFVGDPDDYCMSFIKSMLDDRWTDYLWFPHVGCNSGFLVNECVIYTRNSTWRHLKPLLTRYSSAFNLEMNF